MDIVDDGCEDFLFLSSCCCAAADATARMSWSYLYVCIFVFLPVLIFHHGTTRTGIESEFLSRENRA
jgi:hypothetical protein